MTYPEKLIKGFNHILEKAGTDIRIQYLNESVGSIYDDDVTRTVAVTSWISGIVLPISDRNGTTDALLVEQGKITPQDKKIYLNGSITLNANFGTMRLQIGSPTGDNYFIIPDGARVYQARGTDIYKIAYLRRLTTGSFIGE